MTPRRAGRKQAYRRGFTLLEMVVATILLAIGVVGALGAFASATRATTAADRLTTAALLAQRRFSEIEAQITSLTGGDQQGDFGQDYPGYRWREDVVTTNYPYLFQVTVTIQWGTVNSTNERSFTTYLINNPNQQNQQNQNGTGTSSAGGLGSG